MHEYTNGCGNCACLFIGALQGEPTVEFKILNQFFRMGSDSL